VRSDATFQAVLPVAANHNWTKEDLDKYAFRPPADAPSGQLAWTTIATGDKITLTAPDAGGRIVFQTSDRGLVRSMMLTFLDMGPTQFRILLTGETVAHFTYSAESMGYGKGGFILELPTGSRAETRRIVAKLQGS
jgi:hypothetical protein